MKLGASSFMRNIKGPPEAQALYIDSLGRGKLAGEGVFGHIGHCSKCGVHGSNPRVRLIGYTSCIKANSDLE